MDTFFIPEKPGTDFRSLPVDSVRMERKKE